MPWQAWVKKTVDEVETQWPSSKAKILGGVFSKEGHAESLLRHERSHHTDFLKEGATVYNAFYC